MATRDDIGTIIDADGAKTKVRSEAAPRVFRDNLFAFLKEIGAPRPENSGAMMRGPIEGIDDNEGNAFDAVKPLEGFGSQELYSKLMWMRNATPEMLLRLLKFAPAMANFKQYVRTVSHVSIEVIFYLEVVKLEEPMCSEDEQEIMAVFRRFLPAQRAPNGTAAYKILKDQASVTLAMLAQEFLVDFVKSTAFVNTFMQLRGIRELRGTTEAQELFLELPAKGDWQLPHVPTSRQLTLLNREDEWVRIFHICLDNHELAIILVNMQLPGLPIVFANKAFATLTGYSQAEVLGQNCSFLQGQGTEPQSVRDVKGATQEFRSGVRIEMLNYRNNGESFKNLLSLGFTREYPGGPAKYAVGILVERMQGKGTLVTQSQLRKAQELISVLPRATRTTRAAPPPSAAERIKRSEGPGSDGQGTTAEVLEKTTLQEFNPEKWLDGAMKTMDSLLRCLPEGRDVFSEFMLNQYYEQAFAKGSTVPKGKRGGMALGGMGGSATARGGLGQSMVSLGRSSVGGMGGANRASSAAMRQPASSRAVLSVNDMKGTSSRSLAITTPTGVSGVSGGGSGATPAAMMMAMDVRLSLHGANYFRERAVYGETILGFWLAIDTLKSLSGETLRSKAAECFRIFGAPEVGSKHNMRTADSFKRAKAAPSEMDESEADTQSFRVARGVSPSRQAASAHKPSMADDMADDEALVRSSSGSTLDSGVSVGELQRVMHSTMQLLAFDLLPAFLRSRLLTGLASSLMQTSKDPELELSIRVSRSTAPQDADDWMALFCAVAERLRTCVIVCDMIKPGVPIMYVNKAFEQMTEYTREEAVGRNCRFLQGKQTDATTVAQIAYAIRNGRPISCKLVNYRKSGQPFLNLISLQPICDRDGLYRFMLGTNCEISDKYTQMTKTRLMHMDRLIKLLPTVLELPSSVETKARAELVRETVMEPVLRPYKVQRVGAPSSRQRASSKMLTSSAKTTAFGTPSSAFLSGGAAGARGRGGGCGCGALSEDEPTSQRGKAVGGFSGNRASVAVLSMGSPMRQSTVGASSAALPRPGSSAAPATGDPNMARAGRSSGDSEARAGKSILGFVKLNLRHNIGVDGAGDPIDASAVDDGEDEVVPRPPAGVPSMPNPMRTLGMMSQGMGSGGGRPGMLGTPGMPPGAGGVGRPPTMPPMTPPKPAAASPAKPGAAPPSKPAPRPPPGRSKAPEPPPKPVVEDKDAHLKKTAADVDMSALMGGSDDSDSDSFRSDDESKSESGSDAS
ncbi:hypothetical protein T492DRAFT_621949 [Pavlovales sp. CCMP2436]|nr:hypothetical protein T492DRAFT_621949 [Pavlovales sp. CCMP2436]